MWIARIMLSWGAISALTAWVSGPATFYLLRFLLGVAEAGFFPGVILYLTYWFPAARRGRITAVFMSAIAVSSVLGSLVSGAILQGLDGAGGWAGWRWMFVLEAAPSIVVGLLVLRLLDNRIADAKWLAPEEKALLEAKVEAEASAEQSAWSAFADRRVWLTSAIYFSFIMGLYGISFWLPTIISDLGVKSPMRIGLLSAVPYAVGAVGMVLTGRSADARRERRWHVAGPAILGGVGLALSAMAGDDTFLALTALSLATYGILTALPLFWSLPTAFLGGVGAAAGIAMVNSFGNLAGFVSPYLIGWSKDLTRSTATGMYVLTGFLLAGAVLVLVGMPARLVNR